MDRALQDAEAKLRELDRNRGVAAAATAAAATQTCHDQSIYPPPASATAPAGAMTKDGDNGGEYLDDTAVMVSELRSQVSRARERAEMLEERLDEANSVNRRLEREVAVAAELGVSEAAGTCATAVSRAPLDGHGGDACCGLTCQVPCLSLGNVE